MPTVSVTRTVHLDADADTVWSSLADGDGLAGWLGDRVDLAVEVGAAGSVVDGPTNRRVVVTDVEPGRRIGFVWWEDSQPTIASTVSITVDAAAGGGCDVTVNEQVRGATVAFVAEASLTTLAGAEHRWDARLAALVGEHELQLAPALA